MVFQEQGESGGGGRGVEKSVEDDEDGHLIYRAGDVLQARCNHITYPCNVSQFTVIDALLLLSLLTASICSFVLLPCLVL